MKTLKTPKVAVGKGDAVIEVEPTALRFWEKLGLAPKGGPKDLAAYVLYEDYGGDHRQTLVDIWLANFRSVYQVRWDHLPARSSSHKTEQSKHLGKIHLGKSAMCIKDGHLPVRFDVTLRKTLSTSRCFLLCWFDFLINAT